MSKLTKPERRKHSYTCETNVIVGRGMLTPPVPSGYNTDHDLWEAYHEQEIKAYVDECNIKIQELVRVHEQEIKQAHAIGYSEARLDMAVMVAKLKAERSQ